MKYRSDIDGLRAMAVIPVVLFHAGIQQFSGGFIGVDVFFVISGYLITTIILEDLEQDRFSLIDFYQRRVRRILPVLFLVCLATALGAWLVLSPGELGKFGNSLLGVVSFTANIVFWKSEGYFAEASELNPLLHMWSLAVEEQYYIIFPIFLALIWRFGRNKSFWVIVVLSALSFAVSELTIGKDAQANFYLLHTRAWELLSGSVTAFLVRKHGERKSDILSLIGLALIIFSILTFGETTPFPSRYTLLPVLGTVLVIVFCGQETITSKVLGNRLIVGLGLISYSIYLWHQPLLAFTRIIHGSIHLPSSSLSIIFLLTAVLSCLSWKYVEQPFRNRSLLSTRAIFGWAAAALIFFVFLGIASRELARGREDILAMELSTAEFVYFGRLDERTFAASRMKHPLKPVDTIITGSSRMMQAGTKVLNTPAMNFSVSGASIEDHVALIGEGTAKTSPRRVFIGVDPWLLNQNDKQERWRSLDDLYNYWMDAMQNQVASTEQVSPYFSSNPFTTGNVEWMAPIRQLYERVNIFATSVSDNGASEAFAKKGYDGTHIYDLKFSTRSLASIRTKFDDALNYSMRDFEYDRGAEAKLVEIVQWLKREDIEVVFVLSPYHPELFPKIVAEKPIYLELERSFRRIADENGIGIVGSYDPNKNECTASEFYDGMHPKASCMKKVLNG